MDLFLQTLQSVAAMFLIGVAGFWVVSRRLVAREAIGSLTALAIDIALPCLAFSRILAKFDPGSYSGWYMQPIHWGVFTLGIGVLVLLTRRVACSEVRREFTASLFYQNAIFVPMIVIVSMHGEHAPMLVDLFLFTLLFPSMFFATAHLFFAVKGEKLRWQRIVNPVCVATLLAVGLRLLSWDAAVPGFLVMATERIGDMALPLVVLIIGGSMHLGAAEEARPDWREMLTFVAIKNLLFPLVVLLVVIFLRPAYRLALLLVLQAGVPPLTTVPVITARYGGNRRAANHFFLASFVSAILTLPAMVWLFHVFF